MRFPIAMIMCAVCLSRARAGQLELDKKWIQAHMNQATSGKVTFHIREAKKSVNPIDSGGDDGDLHIAGSSDQIGLPMVAEIINAVPGSDPVKFAQSNAGHDVALNGVWRIWFEHPPSGKHKQFANNLLTGPVTNPDHMFEIHPISVLGTFDLIGNLTRVNGYQAKTNAVTFTNYETRVIDSWKVTDDSVIIESKRAVYNYADFVIRLTEAPHKIPENEDHPRFLAQAEILDKDCSAIVNTKKQPVVSGPRRMVFVEKDADQKVGKAKAGDSFRVMGIPRVNLERLVFYLNHPHEFDNKHVFLPYEMIVIGSKAQTCKNMTASADSSTGTAPRRSRGNH